VRYGSAVCSSRPHPPRAQSGRFAGALQGNRQTGRQMSGDHDLIFAGGGCWYSGVAAIDRDALLGPDPQNRLSLSHCRAALDAPLSRAAVETAEQFGSAPRPRLRLPREPTSRILSRPRRGDAALDADPAPDAAVRSGCCARGRVRRAPPLLAWRTTARPAEPRALLLARYIAP